MPEFSRIIRQGAAATPAKRWLIAACLIAAMLPGFYYCRFGVGMVDESYQILNAVDWRNSPLAPLTAWLSYPLTLATTDILVFRWFSLGLMYAGILIAGRFGYRMTRRPLSAVALTCAALWCAGFSHIQGWLYGWDSFAYFSLIIVLVSTLGYISRPTRRNLLLTAIASSFCILCRIPDAVCIFAVGTVIMISGKRPAGRRIRDLLLYLAVTSAACLAVLSLLYGNIRYYADSLAANRITAHEWANMLHGYHETGGLMLPYMILQAALYLITVRLIVKPRPLAVRLAAACACVAATVFTLHRYHVIPTLTVYSYMVSFIFWSATGILAGRRTPDRVAVFIAIAGLALTICAGSNTGFIKMLTFALMPLLYVYLSGRLRTAYALLLAGNLVVFTVTQIHYRPSFGYEDAGMALATAQIDSGPQRGLRTSVQKAAMIEAIHRDVAPYAAQGFRIKVLGRNFDRFGWELEYGDINPVLRHIWTPIDSAIPGYPEYVSGIARGKGKTVVLWLADLKPEDTLYVPSECPDVWETDILDAHMKRCPVSGPGYRIYRAEPDRQTGR